MYDSHDPQLSADATERTRLNVWARAQALRPNLAYRWEIYRTDHWWVRAYEYAAESDGTLIWDTDRDHPRPAAPYDQSITDLPPGLFVVELPFGLPLISANDRIHYRVRADRTRTLRTAAAHAAQLAHLPRMNAAAVVGEYRPGPRSRRRDAANWSPSYKAAADGLVDAGVLPDDDACHMIGPDPRLGPPDPDAALAGIRWGRLVLYLRTLYQEQAADLACD
ncbi:hypothetical protein [Actinomadura rudentiformis]|uniref:Uncharacterized protein n=1 Tax=Actinomadura rudentiformis TaxID=359158 RepID=A0A6H9YN46_9ACTN|nr:hypothetical protein [Actinomadura rudentiformis]KAB2344835.1 hypothetical protein F8566_30045 [Actinomadura rudentiformis]